MKTRPKFLFICICLIFGISSRDYNQVKIPEHDFQYIVYSLQMIYGMNYDDAKNSVLELEHFYSGIKFHIIDNRTDHPQTAIKNAWEIHIINTRMYFNFTYSIFGEYLHYRPVEQQRGQLYVYEKLKYSGINNMNETVWLLKSFQSNEDYSLTESWNIYYKQSRTLSTFNERVNRFLKKFIEEHNPSTDHFQVLDIAMGQGRNSIWLAQKGYNVTGFDSSDEGIQIAINNARQMNLTTLKVSRTTIEEFQFGLEQWNLIICLYFPIINETSYLYKLEQSLKYKGLLIVEVFHWDGLSGDLPLPIDVTYKTNALPLLFPNLTTIIYEEPIDYSDFGNKLTKIIRYVGQKNR